MSMKALFILSTIPLLTLPFLFGCASAPKKPEKMAANDYSYMEAYLNWDIPKKMKQSDVVGLSIAVVDDKNILWSKGFGYADKAAKRPANSKTVYRIGSISKVFTAMGMMQLAEAGQLDLDAPIRTYIPEFSILSRFGSTDKITPRNIMNHHSGLPCDILKGWTSESDTMLLSRLAQAHTAYPPNTIFSYSNVGVSLLGLAMGRIVGDDFSNHMERVMFHPMKMHHTSYILTPSIEKRLSKGYCGRKEKKQLPIRDRAAGSVYSNVRDMSRFMQAALNQGRTPDQRIIGSKTLSMMTRPQSEGLPLDFGFQMGLGWCLDGFPVAGAQKVIWHNGGTFLFNSHMAILPEKKLGVVVLSNSAQGGDIVGEISAKALELALEAKYGLNPAPTAANEEKKERGFTPSWSAKLVGDYGAPDSIFTVSAKGDRLWVDADGYRFRLVPYKRGRIGLQKRLWGIFPIPIKELDKLRFTHETVDGQELVVIHGDGISQPLAKKIFPVPIPGNWAAMAGEFEVTDLDPSLNPQNIGLRVKENRLTLSMEIPVLHDGTFELYFQPISATEAVTMGLGRYAGETMRIVDLGGHKGLYFSGFLFKKKAGPSK